MGVFLRFTLVLSVVSSVTFAAASKTAANFETPDLVPASRLTVQYDSAANSAIKVQVVGEKRDDQLTCKFKLDHDLFKMKAKWNPLVKQYPKRKLR